MFFSKDECLILKPGPWFCMGAGNKSQSAKSKLLFSPAEPPFAKFLIYASAVVY